MGVGGRVPWFVAWLAMIVLAGAVAVVIAVVGGRQDDDQRELDRVLEWRGTTYVAEGTFVRLSGATQNLPFHWAATADYRITVPTDAAVAPGMQINVELPVYRTGKRPPRADEQSRTLDLRVADDEHHRVAEAGRDLPSLDERIAAARTDVDRARSRHHRTEIIGWSLWALVAAGVLVGAFARPARADRFAGRRVPAYVAGPDGPYNQARWAERARLLPALEKDALSPELPVGLCVTTLVLGVVALPVRHVLPALLVLSAAAVVGAALLSRERRTSALRTAWALLGRESGMGVAPDTEARLAARRGAVLLRLSAAAGVAAGVLLLAIGALEAATLRDTNAGSGRAAGLLTLGCLVVVTSAVAVAAGVLQQRDAARERSSAPGRAEPVYAHGERGNP